MAVQNETNVKIAADNIPKLNQVADRCVTNNTKFVNTILREATIEELVDFYLKIVFRSRKNNNEPGGAQD